MRRVKPDQADMCPSLVRLLTRRMATRFLEGKLQLMEGPGLPLVR
jgi:hypothetical protein